MALYDALRPTHPVRDPRAPGGERYSFETFPHAITWHLRGGLANARRKREQRRALRRAPMWRTWPLRVPGC
jgi:hypothetical protein